MEFHIARDELIRALSRVQGIVERRSTNPIIANVLISASADKGLVVTATDTEISFVGSYEARVEDAGEITVEAKHLFDIARSLPTPDVHLKSAQDAPMEIEIRSGKAFFRIKGMPADNFPPVPKIGGEPTMKISSGELRKLIERTAFCISTDDTRSGLNGASVESPGDGRIVLVATDGHRLGLAEGTFEGALDTEGGLLLPRKGLGELRKLSDDADTSFDVSFVQNQAVFRRPGLSISMRLLEGTFPDYRQVIPSQSSRAVVVDRNEFAAGLKRVSILAAERSHNVRFSVGDGVLGLQSNNTEFGSASEELDAVVDGEPLEVGFNARYFQDVLNVLGDERVKLEFGDALSPCLVTPVSDDVAMFVIMPMRLD